MTTRKPVRSPFFGAVLLLLLLPTEAPAQAQGAPFQALQQQITQLQVQVTTLSSQQAALRAAVAALSSEQTAAFSADSGSNPIAIAQNTDVLSLNLAQGNYVFSGKVVAGDTSTTNVVICVLFNQGGGGGPSLLDISQTPTLPAGSVATLPLVGRLSLSGSATISVVCTAQNAGNAIAQFAQLNAVRVATLELPQ